MCIDTNDYYCVLLSTLNNNNCILLYRVTCYETHARVQQRPSVSVTDKFLDF